jgi:AcrR family transcriptional regulator
MSDTRRSRKAPMGGRMALILAAERLIALRGLSGVSLREINEAAGLRNVAAAHYHFGSREGLVEAILAHRLPPIQVRRQAVIDELQAAGRFSDVRCLVGALVWPLVAEMRPRPEGNYYLRFTEQLRREREDSPIIVLGNRVTPTWARIMTELRRLLTHLPPQVAALRLRLESSHLVSGLASIETWLEQGELSPGDLHLAADILIDGVVNAMNSPASVETLSSIRGAPDLAASET